MDDAADGPRPVALILADFARMVADEHGVEDILLRLGEACAQVVDVDGVGVLLLVESGSREPLAVATSSSRLGAAVERLEAELGEGPCSEAVQEEQQIVVPDLAQAHDRYPEFVPRALEAGARAIHALPMAARGRVFGAVDLISAVPREYTPEQLGRVQLLADVAGSYVVNCRIRADATALAAQLQQALDSRIVIEQAKGVIVGRQGVPTDEAFVRLRSHARSTQTSIREVALQVLRGELDLP